jgi:hypothetical protein
MKSKFLFYAIIFLLAAIVYASADAGTISFEIAFICFIALSLAALLKSFRSV